MNIKHIDFSAGFPIHDPDILPSFQVAPTFCEVSGPGALVRLVSSAGARRMVEYWFEEALFLRIRDQARRELREQQAASGKPFSSPFSSMVALYMRHCFRDRLAVCMDWGNDFGAYRRLPLTAQDKLIALVGPVSRQAAYSEKDPQYQAVVANDVWFRGQATQYVVDFSDSRNVPLNGRVSSPIPL